MDASRPVVLVVVDVVAPYLTVDDHEGTGAEAGEPGHYDGCEITLLVSVWEVGGVEPGRWVELNWSHVIGISVILWRRNKHKISFTITM